MFYLWLYYLKYRNGRKEKIKPIPYRHPIFVVIGSLILASWISVFDSQLITIHLLRETLIWMWEHPVPILLDCIVLSAISIILWSIFKKTWIAFSLPAILVFLFSVINYYKMVINNTPILYSDLFFAKSFMSIAKFAIPQIKFEFFMLCAFLLLLGTGILLAWIDLRIPHVRWSRMSLAGVGIVFFMVFTLTDCFQIPAATIAAEYKTQEERIAYCGSLWAFYCAYAASEKGQIEYSEEDMRNLISYLNMMNVINDQEKNEEIQKPNVIFVMSESFFDVTRLPNVKYFKDPLPNYHTLAENYTSGTFLTNTSNGGTGYVEMEVQTGLCSYLLNEGDTLSSLKPDEIYDRIPCISRVFKEEGYDLTFLHSHTSELYNRDIIYPRLGYDQIFFSDSFPEDAEIKGDYISDRAFADQLIKHYKERDPDKPLMLFGVTMENHQPSYKGKFAQEADIPFLAPTLDEQATEILQSYLTGAHDADASLGQLVDYFSQVDEPVMIIFWGDHLPSMMVNTTETIFSQLGMYSSVSSITWTEEQLKQILTTDYIIWTNYEEVPEPDHTESSILLGLSVIKRIGFTLKDYFAWLDAEVAPNLLMYRPRLYVDSQGNAYSEVPEEDEDMINTYAMLTYDIVYGENTVFSSEEMKEQGDS